MIYLIMPEPFDIFKCFCLGNIVGHNNTISSFVIRRCDSFESLLSCSIPNLYFNSFVSQLDCFEPEVHSDRRNIVLTKRIILQIYSCPRYYTLIQYKLLKILSIEMTCQLSSLRSKPVWKCNHLDILFWLLFFVDFLPAHSTP